MPEGRAHCLGKGAWGRWLRAAAADREASRQQLRCPHATPNTLPRLQVTSEVGQECLRLQEQMRGGLLGAGHSWVASPLEPAPTPEASSEAASSEAAPPAPVQQPGLLRRAAGGLWSAAAAAADVQLVSAVIAAAGALLLWWHWLLRLFR